MTAAVRAGVAALVGLLAGSAASGCAHSLGEPPTDLELRNDGSAESRAHLYREYQVSYVDGAYSRPCCVEYGADATSDEAMNYLGSSEAADEELGNVVVAFDRFNHSVSFVPAILGSGLALGASIGLYFALSGGALEAVAAGDPATDAASDVGRGTAYGAIGGLAAAVPVVLLAEFTFKPIVRTVAGSSYRSASRAFNQELQTRIDANIDPALLKQRLERERWLQDRALEERRHPDPVPPREPPDEPDEPDQPPEMPGDDPLGDGDDEDTDSEDDGDTDEDDDDEDTDAPESRDPSFEADAPGAPVPPPAPDRA